MRFVSKAPRTCTFWVEDFTKEDKTFFKSLGFTEKKPHVSAMVAKAFKMKPTLHFDGTGIFGLWTQAEIDKIALAIYDKYPEMKKIKVEQFYED
jgi:hypothetical protein